MNQEQTRIVNEVKENGIAFSSVQDLLNEDQKGLFNKGVEYFNGFLKAPHIQERCQRIAALNPIQDKNKWYEITQYEYLKSGIGLDNPIVQMYMQDVFIDMATEFHGVSPKVRNILTWVHPQNPLQQEINSQVWHRDQEDWEVFKVFVLFSNVGPTNGPTQYVKKTQHGGKYDKITNNMNGQSTSVFTFPIPEEEIVSSEGPAGTIVFMNTNGLHKGGLVKEGVRVMTQANFLKPTAPLIENGALESFDYSDKINILDRNSSEYISLTDIQKQILG
tara:strand:+ start:2447 stop:3274 length:828 start_codon:yes stop_codon:yes gene_type:complete